MSVPIHNHHDTPPLLEVAARYLLLSPLVIIHRATSRYPRLVPHSLGAPPCVWHECGKSGALEHQLVHADGDAYVDVRCYH
jgi:hypothetical protein